MEGALGCSQVTSILVLPGVLLCYVSLGESLSYLLRVHEEVEVQDAEKCPFGSKYNNSEWDSQRWLCYCTFLCWLSSVSSLPCWDPQVESSACFSSLSARS